jgi:hypothetical protein
VTQPIQIEAAPPRRPWWTPLAVVALLIGWTLVWGIAGRAYLFDTYEGGELRRDADAAGVTP